MGESWNAAKFRFHGKLVIRKLRAWPDSRDCPRQRGDSPPSQDSKPQPPPIWRPEQVANAFRRARKRETFADLIRNPCLEDFATVLKGAEDFEQIDTATSTKFPLQDLYRPLTIHELNQFCLQVFTSANVKGIEDVWAALGVVLEQKAWRVTNEIESSNYGVKPRDVPSSILDDLKNALTNIKDAKPKRRVRPPGKPSPDEKTKKMELKCLRDWKASKLPLKVYLDERGTVDAKERAEFKRLIGRVQKRLRRARNHARTN